MSQSRTIPAPLPTPPPRLAAFGSLRNPAYRGCFGGELVSMLADNIEHVITYWVLWQTFQSPLLAGFAVIAHWTPALFLSVHIGRLAERYDCRRIIQVGQGVYVIVSLSWAVLFATGTLQVWHAVILLMCHGLAGAIWSPASQLIINDIVGPQLLPSAVRLSATSRQLAILFGPAIGGVLMLLLTPAGGMVFNAFLFLPLTIWLIRLPYTGHGRDAQKRPAVTRLRLLETFHVLKEVSGQRPLLAMIALGGLSSLLVGNAFQAQMPGFAHDLGADNTGMGYSMLLGANAAGAFFGGLLLETTGLLRPGARSAIVCALLWCLSIMGFAAAPNYPVAMVCLLLAGMLNLAYLSMAQALVQLQAPPERRGRIVGLFNTASQGLRVGSGVTVGVLGSLIGIHWSLGLSAFVLFVSILALARLLTNNSTPTQLLAAAPERVSA